MTHQPLMNRIDAKGRTARCVCGWTQHTGVCWTRGRKAVINAVAVPLVTHLRKGAAA